MAGRAGLVPAVRPRRLGPPGALRGVRRRLRDRPRLDRQPRRHRYRARIRPLRPRQSGQLERRRRAAPAVDREVRAGGIGHRSVRRVIGQRQRPRRPDDDPVDADHAAIGHRPALRVQLLLRTCRQRVVCGPPPRDRRGWRNPDGAVRGDRLGHRGAGQLADRLGSDGCLGGQDDPAPVRGARRWPGLDGRGRHRRRAHSRPTN